LIAYSNLIDALYAAPPERPFVTMWIDEDERESITFGEFRRMAGVQAGDFAAQGIAPGDRIVLILPQGIPAMTSFVAAIMLGAVPAFLAYPNFKVEPSKYRSGLAGVTTNLNAKAVVIDEDFPEEMLANVNLGQDAILLRARQRAGAASSSPEFSANLRPDGLALIQHSAGTTGLQKGVALTHAAVLRQLDHLAQALKIDSATDQVYSWLPLYHDMGLIACFMLPLVFHLPVVMQSPIDWVMRPETMLQIIDECRCTLAWMPNFAFQFVPRRTPQNHWKSYDLSSLRLLINCSEPVRATSMEQFRNAFEIRPGVLQSCYAMAENVFAVTQSHVSGAAPVNIRVEARAFRKEHRIIAAEGEDLGAISFTSSGRILPNHQLRIVSDSGAVLGDDSVGEIAIKSDCLFEGYYNRPDLTAQVMIDGWYHTGDLGFLHQGELYVAGRRKDLLIVGGENIYPQDIEELIAGHPAIHDGRAIAMGVYNPDLGTEEIVIVAEVEHEASLQKAIELEQELRTRVVSGMGVAVRTIYLKPPKWIVKSTAGKPARAATREKLLREHPELNGETSA
jgi:fatty-acyl-CoA synthase